MKITAQKLMCSQEFYQGEYPYISDISFGIKCNIIPRVCFLYTSIYGMKQYPIRIRILLQAVSVINKGFLRNEYLFDKIMFRWRYR